MKRILISVVLAAICLSSFGQKQEEKKKFQIKGQPIVTVFANYHAGMEMQIKNPDSLLIVLILGTNSP